MFASKALLLANGKVNFKAIAPETVVVGDQFRLSYTVNSLNVRDFRIASIKGFEVLMGPSRSQQSSTQIVNGTAASSNSITFTYILMANNEGIFSIPGASITAEGNPITSNSVRIKVLPTGKRASNTNGSVHDSKSISAKSVSNNDLFITATVSKSNVYEQEAESNWSISSELKLASLVQVTLNAAVNYSPVNSETLTTELKAASAHSSHGGEGSYTPQNPQQWSDFLAKRAGEGFAKEINRALASQSTSLKKGLEGYNTQLNEYFSALGKYFEDISKQMILGTQSIQRRSQLLWVKEALFSVGQKMSYRDIPKSDLPFVLAKDMQSLITFIYPVSVDFFTKEILRNVITDADVRLSFSNLLDVKNLKSVQSILGVQNTIDSSRKPLINYIQRLVTNQTTIEQMENETGIKPESEISLTDFTVYLLHDLQSIGLSILK